MRKALKVAEASTTLAEPLRRAQEGKALFAILQRISTRFSDPDSFGRLTYGERLVWDVAHMEAEVLNGGFRQYLCNSTGASAEDVKDYLREIGAKSTLGHFRRLSKVFPRRKVPIEDQQRSELLKGWEDQNGSALLDDLSEAFYRKAEDLTGLLLAYVQEHLEEFSEPSENLVKNLKRKSRIKKHFAVSPMSKVTAKSEQGLQALKEFANSDPTAEWKEEMKSQLKALALAGKKDEVIRIYSGLFMCSMKKAKAEVERMISAKKD